MKRTRITPNTFEASNSQIKSGRHRLNVRKVLETYIEIGCEDLTLSKEAASSSLKRVEGMSFETMVKETIALQDKFPRICNLGRVREWLDAGGKKVEEEPPVHATTTTGPSREEMEAMASAAPKTGEPSSASEGTQVPGESEEGAPSEQQGEQQGGHAMEQVAKTQQEAAKAGNELDKVLQALAKTDETVLGESKKYTDERVTQLESKIPKMKSEEGATQTTRHIIEIKRPDEPPVQSKEVYHPNFGYVLACAMARVPVYMVGPAGTGKTTIGGQVAKSLSLDYHPMSFNGLMSHSALFGFVPMSGDGYQTTPFRSAYEKGGVCLWDEIDAANANILTGANMATSNGMCSFPDRAVEKHKDFVLLAGANTFGRGANRNYVGRNSLDAATLDRFAFVELDYDNGFEESMLTGTQVCPVVDVYKKGAKQADANEWLQWVRRVRDHIEKLDIRMVLSPRVILYGTRLLGIGMDRKHIENVMVWWKMDAATRSRIKGDMGIKEAAKS